MVDTLRAIDKGATVKVFLNSLAVGTHSLIGAKGIKSVKELKGKRVMTGGPATSPTSGGSRWRRPTASIRKKDVELMFSGATSARLAALVAGGVDATMLSTPQSFQAVQDGYADLGPVAPYLGEFPMMIWHVNDAWAQTHEKELLAFIRAHNKAVRYMSDPAHRQEVSQMLADASKSSLDDALKTWDLCMQVKAFVLDGVDFRCRHGAGARYVDPIRRHQDGRAARGLHRSPLRQGRREVAGPCNAARPREAGTQRKKGWIPAYAGMSGHHPHQSKRNTRQCASRSSVYHGGFCG